MRIIMSGGGTGGHIFPAISIAKAIKKLDASIDIRFIGALGKLEMTKVPEAGFPIDGLPISGFHRKMTLRNLAFPFKLTASFMNCYRILRKYKPDALIGTGGYASGPALGLGSMMGIPTYIQEQNSYPGVTNRLLAPRARAIFSAFEAVNQYFKGQDDKIHCFGNPVRDLFTKAVTKEAAAKHFNLDPTKRTILVMGGSLGARTMNEAMIAHTALIQSNPNIQWIWQIGKLYEQEFLTHALAQEASVFATIFIDNMDVAYSLADLVICRAGALTLSELEISALPSILVPSPNVAEDHQTKNAQALVAKGAAEMIKDDQARKTLVPRAIELVQQTDKLNDLKTHIKPLAKPKATENIAQWILKDLKK